MTFLSNMLRRLRRDGIDPGRCLVCIEPAHYMDALALPWCESHEHHGKVLEWGYHHDFPELHFGQYAIGPGDECWWLPIMLSVTNSANKGDESFMWTALAYIEHLDSLEKAS